MKNRSKNEAAQKAPKNLDFRAFWGGPKRLKTDHFEVKIGPSTSNSTFLRVLKKFFGPLEKASFLKQFLKPF